jgi:hypothetical protein
MELSTSREATSCVATQEPPSILWNPKVQYSIHNSPQLVPILSQTNAAHTTPSYLSKIHLKIAIGERIKQHCAPNLTLSIITSWLVSSRVNDAVSRSADTRN